MGLEVAVKLGVRELVLVDSAVKVEVLLTLRVCVVLWVFVFESVGLELIDKLALSVMVAATVCVIEPSRVAEVLVDALLLTLFELLGVQVRLLEPVADGEELTEPVDEVLRDPETNGVMDPAKVADTDSEALDEPDTVSVWVTAKVLVWVLLSDAVPTTSAVLVTGRDSLGVPLAVISSETVGICVRVASFGFVSVFTLV